MRQLSIRRRLAALLTICMALGSMSVVASAAPSDSGCNNRNINGQVEKLLNCIDAEDVLVHLNALQDIADANGGVRESGTPGYDESAAYIAGLLDDAGLDIEIQEFDFSLFEEISSSVTVNGSPLETQTFSFSSSGTVTDGNVVPVDLDLGLGNSSTSGCEASDFDGLDFSGPNDIALMQRGACAFADKALNADAAGAEGAIIFNQGNTPDRTDIIFGTLGDGVIGVLTIPVLDLAYADGLAVLDAGIASVSAETIITTSTTTNVIADLPGVNPDNVVMAGAHLDS
ncbi:MAG: PA domain-containing protein, partial [Acidimicrobiia bacterium]